MRRHFRAASKRGGCLLPLFLLLVLAALGAWIFSASLLPLPARYLIEDDGPQKADAVVVLGGDNYGDRTLKGAELVKAGYAPIVIVSGPPRLIGWDSDIQIQFAIQKGYPASYFRGVHIPSEDESTRTESRYLGKYLLDSGIHKILLVTSNYHTRRAAFFWRHENPKIWTIMIPTDDPFKYFTPETWWKTRPGQKVFLYEWLKTISVKLGV